MIRLPRALAWLRWRLLVNGLRGRRRDNAEQVSRITRLLVGAIVAVSLIPGSMLLAVLAFAGGRGMAAGDPKAAVLATGARAAIALVTVLVAVGPVLRFGGAAQSFARLSLLPIPRRALFAGELASQLADPWILLLVPATLALPAGLLAGGAPIAAAWMAAAGGLVLALLATLSGAAAMLGALVFRRRRWGELASIGLLVGITVIAYLPVVTSRGEIFKRAESLTPEQKAALGRTIAFDTRSHPWMKGAPWELYARALETTTPPARRAPLLPLAGLAAATLVFGSAARWEFGRLMDAPSQPRTGRRKAADAPARIPGMSPASSAVAWAFFRLVTRSVRGRVVLFTAPLPAFLFAFLWRGRSLGIVDPAYTGVLVVAVAGVLALMSLTSFLSDQFAVDRAGLTLTFLGPASGTEIVAGKAVGALAVYAIPLGLGTIGAAALHPRGSPLVWVGTWMCLLAAYLASSPVEAALAAWFPAPFDLSRLKAGNPHPLASFLGLLAAILAFGAGGGVFAATIAATGSPAAGLGAAAIVFAIGAAVARIGWPLAARALDARRENLAMIAQGR